MAENDMNYANKDMSKGLPQLYRKVLAQPALSPSKSTQAVSHVHSAEARPPLRSKAKPKQPYLKRGTGLQNRLDATKQRRYVPKGGFIKGRAEDETGRQQAVYLPDTAYDQSKAPLSCRHTSTLELAKQSNNLFAQPISQSVFAGAAPAEADDQPSQQSGCDVYHHGDKLILLQPHNMQDSSHSYPSVADTETELDADTALVHFPGGESTAHSRQPHDSQLSDQHYLSEQQSADAAQLPNRSGSAQQQSRFQCNVDFDNSPGQQGTDNVLSTIPAAVGWQLQQAAEVAVRP